VDDLVQFLRDRLDEDEALALEAPKGPWHIGNAVDPTQPCHVHTFPGARMVADGLNWLVAEHIARQHPARVLAEVEAKRRAVDECAYWNEKLAQEAANPSKVPYPCLGNILDAVNPILRALALPYADHPAYKPEWRP
jgi:hypothetical protein